MKTCRGCGDRKPTNEFHRHRQMKDGHLNYCKVCVRERVRNHLHEKITDAEWRRRERERSRKKERAWRVRGGRRPVRSAAKRAANTAVSNAVRDGRIVPPEVCDNCEHDFSEFRREAHHPDYSKPLEVEWLCALCHGKRHRRAA